MILKRSYMQVDKDELCKIQCVITPVIKMQQQPVGILRSFFFF